MYQNTLKDKISFSGIGIHSGLSANIIISPANDNQGISFIRTDIDRKISVLANFKNVSSTIRSTNLKYKNIEIHTVEHLLAALYYARSDNS
jgi:UDP-3-O-acyl-N-acetylglucosamine deacetylase